YNRGVVYFKLNNYQSAIDDFNEAIRLKQDYSDAYNGRGIAWLSQGNPELGCPDAKRACDLGNCRALELAKRKGDCR
ncbi:MAG TPA: tetratricopeptide repeat protein, partial [Smithellaceae bacterium]|nr:tetratricopeptide repeat protein [Smithellaceae bacterium]